MLGQAIDMIKNIFSGKDGKTAGGKQYVGKDVGGGVGGLVGSIFGPIGSVVGGAIGSEAGGDIEGLSSGGDPMQYFLRLLTGGTFSPIPQDPENKQKKKHTNPNEIDFGPPPAKTKGGIFGY